MASHESPDRPWREILKQMFVCQRIERNGKGTEIGKGRSSHGKLKERLIHLGREPNGYSALAILRYVYPIHSRLHPSFFRFDDDTKLDDGVKLKKRDLGDVPYLEKSVSYLQETLNQIGINEEKVAIPALFPVSLRISACSRAEEKVAISALFPPFEGYFPIFFSLEMTLYSDGDML